MADKEGVVGAVHTGVELGRRAGYAITLLGRFRREVWDEGRWKRVVVDTRALAGSGVVVVAVVMVVGAVVVVGLAADGTETRPLTATT